MKRLLVVVLATGLCLYGFTLYGQALSINDISSEIEDAFLGRPATVDKQNNNNRPVFVHTATDAMQKKEGSSMNGEEWRARLESMLDIPKAPVMDGMALEILRAPGGRYIVAVYNTGEEDVVYKARQIVWPRARMLFNKDKAPVIHVMPVSGGTFGIGKTFYTIMNESNGFNVLYVPPGVARKASLMFSGNEGAFLTPDGFVCRVRKHVPDAGGRE